MLIEPVGHKAIFIFENIDDFETYIIAIGVDCDIEDVTFTGYVYKLNTPQFKVVKRSAYDEGTNYMKEIVDYLGQYVYIPTSGMCFIKCIKYFTEKNYTEVFRDFIRNEIYRSGVMTSARLQPFCRKRNINIGCFDGKKINPRNVTERKTSLFIHKIHFSLFWKSNSISFIEAIEEEFKPNFKVVDNVISDKHV